MTKWENKKDLDAGEVNDWINSNIPRINGKGITVEMNRDGTIASIDIDDELTTQEQALLENQYKELKGKKK